MACDSEQLDLTLSYLVLRAAPRVTGDTRMGGRYKSDMTIRFWVLITNGMVGLSSVVEKRATEMGAEVDVEMIRWIWLERSPEMCCEFNLGYHGKKTEGDEMSEQIWSTAGKAAGRER